MQQCIIDIISVILIVPPVLLHRDDGTTISTILFAFLVLDWSYMVKARNSLYLLPKVEN